MPANAREDEAATPSEDDDNYFSQDDDDLAGCSWNDLEPEREDRSRTMNSGSRDDDDTAVDLHRERPCGSSSSESSRG